MAETLDRLVREIRACRVCRDDPRGRPLAHEPRPVLRVSATAGLGVFGQAPGARVHASGVPFSDPSGERLRSWMAIDAETFYDTARVAIVPMGFCFPGYDDKGSDLPPRRECAPLWRARLMARLPRLSLVLLVGAYAQRWHLGAEAKATLSDTVASFEEYLARSGTPRYFPLPHPSWRNTGWISRNPWFEERVLPRLRSEVRAVLDGRVRACQPHRGRGNPQGGTSRRRGAE